jgi:hypothetical protein
MKDDTMDGNIKINADCALCKEKRPVKSITFNDVDQTMDLELQYGHPKSYKLIQSDLSALYEHMRHMEENDPGYYKKKK